MYVITLMAVMQNRQEIKEGLTGRNNYLEKECKWRFPETKEFNSVNVVWKTMFLFPNKTAKHCLFV